MGVDRVLSFGGDGIDPANPAFTGPFRRDAAALRAQAPDLEVVLLASIATEKYAVVLSEVFGEGLRFPAAFVGRGDMSRGGLLLRHARSGVELEYRGLGGAPRTGSRPARLDRKSR